MLFSKMKSAASALVLFSVLFLQGCTNGEFIPSNLSSEESNFMEAHAATKPAFPLNPGAVGGSAYENGTGASAGNDGGESLTAQDGAPALFAKSKKSSDTGYVVIGTDASFPPYEFMTADGRMMGFEIDLLTAIMQDQGLKFKFVNLNFPKLFDNLEYGKTDMVVASLAETPERDKIALASDPYMRIRMAMAINMLDTKTKSALDLKGKTVSVLKESNAVDTVRNLLGNDVKILENKTSYLSLKSLLFNQAQAVVDDAEVIKYNMRSNRQINARYVEDNANFPEYSTVFYISSKKPELKEKIDQGLANIKAYGTYQKIHDKWFKDDAQANFGSVGSANADDDDDMVINENGETISMGPETSFLDTLTGNHK